MSELPKIPRIFAGQPIRYATSDKTDGHMSFGHVDDVLTLGNINGFLAGLNWPIKGFRYIRVAYGPERTYDEVVIFDQSVEDSGKMSLTDRLVADAVITDQIGVVLLLPTADCYSVTLYDPKHKVLALTHLGWQGTHAHLLKKVIETMKQHFGSQPSDLLIHFGPGIPAKYYVHSEPIQLKMPGWREHIRKVTRPIGLSGGQGVSEKQSEAYERYAKRASEQTTQPFAKSIDGVASSAREQVDAANESEGGYEIDLLSYNLEQLSIVGIDGHHIELDPRNTVESDELESHYMHTKQGLPVARRFLTAVMLSEI